MKYILVTGGGIDKEIVTSSIGALLRACNLRVNAIKIDTYVRLNTQISSRTTREVFVTNDGSEVDQDLGSYERFLDIPLAGANHITTGKIYQLVINKERRGDYLGKTVQTVHHITDCIQDWIKSVALTPVAQLSQHNGHINLIPDVCIIELGGAVHDTRGMAFTEALRQFASDHRREDLCCVHVVYVPRMKASGEFKTKALQSNVEELRRLIICPNMIVCRSDSAITDSVRDKISKSCGVRADKVINLPDFKTIYGVPIELERQDILNALAECLQLNVQLTTEKIQRWNNLSLISMNANEVDVALVGKYTNYDCYSSVIRALEHSCYSLGLKPSIHLIDSSMLIKETSDPQKHAQAWQDLKNAHVLVVPGAFGYHGFEGKIAAIHWARINKVPFLGIGLGFQSAAVEYARNVLGLKDANSAEFAVEAPSNNPIVIEMLEYQDPDKKVGTMRLGSRQTRFVTNTSIVRKLYGNVETINERHRHRFEINPNYLERLEESGLRFVGKNEDGSRIDILELDEAVHPYFVAVQFHPEYLTRPLKPSPPYLGLIKASRSRIIT